ncbi:alpha/beta hydrolase [Thalassococcus sp. S3]|uniref:alpha/beta hydrolase n=1 Tax=Thalassococcus sp. S3 TaxID=2017482 RepID=UPI0013EE516E|nr:alpha/beta fold hydrolase [Thalassococcus sp. S3]
MRSVFVWFCILLLAGCSSTDRFAAPIVAFAPTTEQPPRETVFFGTTRLKRPDGTYGFGRSGALELGRVTVAIPPLREPGSVSNGGAQPDPRRDFMLTEKTVYSAESSFQTDLRQRLRDAPADQREVTVFVHGFNTSYTDAMFRMAQIRHDLDIPGQAVVYAWPSRAHPLGYEYDDESALFARDGLEQLLETITRSGASRIVVVAHSMGSYLAMETLRQLEIERPGWTGRHVSGVILISPDIGIDLFRSQLARMPVVPDPFVIFVSRRDIFLRLSATLTGEPERLGNIEDGSSIADLPVSVVDVSAFSDGNGNHFVPAASPTLIALFRQADRLDQTFLRREGGSTYNVLHSQRVIVRRAGQVVVEQFDR